MYRTGLEVRAVTRGNTSHGERGFAYVLVIDSDVTHSNKRSRRAAFARSKDGSFLLARSPQLLLAPSNDDEQYCQFTIVACEIASSSLHCCCGSQLLFID
jgi:hypothetical protein